MSSSKQALTRVSDVAEERRAPIVVSKPIQPWIDNSPVPRGSNLASYLEVPFMHKRLIVFCIILGILGGWAAILTWPRSYESSAKLMVKVGRESVSLDPTATTGSNLLSLQKTQEEEIATVLQVLNSRHVAENVVDKLGVGAILSGQLPRAESDQKPVEDAESEGIPYAKSLSVLKEKADDWLYTALLHAGIKDDISDRELAVKVLQGCISTDAPKKSSVVVVEGRSRSPEMAQAIVREVTDAFLNEHLKVSHTEGSYDFFLQQSSQVEQTLNDLLDQRAKYMKDGQVVSIDANRDLIKDRLSQIDRDLAVAEGQLEQALAEVNDLKGKVASAKDEVIAAKVEGTDETWSGMRQKVYELEIEEQRLAANYADKHPKLKRIRTQLAGARDILKELSAERVNENTTPNPIKTGLREEMQDKETLITGLRSMISEKKAQRANLEKLSTEFVGQERHLTELDRDIEQTTNNLKMMREKLEEARVNEELRRERFSNIHVFQPATFVERAVSPKKKILGAGFVVLGLLTGLALSFLREGSAPTLRTADDVESRLGIPVVSTIPRLRRMRAPRLREQRVYRKKCQEMMAEILMSQHRPGQSRGRSIGVIGVDVGAGASTLAINLATTSDVDCNLKTVLVDADSRKRSVSKMFGLNGAPGLCELVRGTASHDECLQKVENAEIELISSAAESSDEILSSGAAEIVQALEAYLQEYDLMIVDLPAASQPDQAVALAQHLDCILVVAESEKTQTVAADRLLNRLCQSETEVLGVVLTKTRSYLPKFVRGFVGPQQG